MTGCSRPWTSVTKRAPPAEEASGHLSDVKASRRLIIVLAIAAVAVVALAGVGIYGLLAGPPAHPDPDANPTAPQDTQQPKQGFGDSILVPISVTDDAEDFARSVALALFEWDTRGITAPNTVSEHLMAAAEPSGIEAHGLYQDVQSYLPTTSQWRQLRQYETRQQLSIQALFIPESWPVIVDDPANSITEDVTAVTVEGTRIREGGWHGQDTVKEFPVSFTVFLSCPSDSDRCYLLRLSALNLALR